MLNRFRDFVKRLELPQEEQGNVVYRIIDEHLNAVEVTSAQYTAWRMQYDIASRAVVGQDTAGDVMVRTTFSIMPEDRSYKPFGTSAYELSSYEVLTQYSQRYDTWREAEQGHRNILDRIRREQATARATDQRAEALSGTAGAVRLAVSAGLAAMFRVHAHSEEEVTVHTPLLRINGSNVDVVVAVEGNGFRLTGSIDRGVSGAGEMSEAYRVTAEDGEVIRMVDDEADLPQGIIGVAQAVACISVLPAGNG